MGFLDSDEEIVVKKSKLSRKKASIKDNVSKPHTSTQMDITEPIIGRGGRPSRKNAEEVAFQRELEAALRLSSEEVSTSSGEVVPPRKKEVTKDHSEQGQSLESRKEYEPTEPLGLDLSQGRLVEPEGGDVQDIRPDTVPVVQSDTIPSPKSRTIASDDEIDIEPFENAKASESGTTMRTQRRNRIIESDDEFDVELERKMGKKETAGKRRKVGEAWVTSGKKKENIATNENVNKRKRKPNKKYVHSSESEGDVSDASGSEFTIERKTCVQIIKDKCNPNVQQPITPLKISRVLPEETRPLRPQIKQIEVNDGDIKDDLKIRRSKPHTKYVENSESEGDESEEFDLSEDSDGDFSVELESKVPTRKVKSESKGLSSKISNESKKIKPLSPHNPQSPALKIPSKQTPINFTAPRRLNIDGTLSKQSSARRQPQRFQSPTPSKTLSVNLPTPPPAPVPSRSISSLMSNLPPALSRSCTSGTLASSSVPISSLLSSLPSSLTRSSTAPTPSATMSPLPTGRTSLTPGMKKLPAWTPPSRVGQSKSLSSNSVSVSPAIGLRLGLSRNFKVSKPLHSSIKNPL